MPVEHDDPTIPDRLLLRALIEDGLPSRAGDGAWPVRTPADFARVVFDAALGVPYEDRLSEPVFANLPKSRLKTALTLAQELMGEAGRARLDELIASSAALRSRR
jgi:hypothetical protein